MRIPGSRGGDPARRGRTYFDDDMVTYAYALVLPPLAGALPLRHLPAHPAQHRTGLVRLRATTLEQARTSQLPAEAFASPRPGHRRAAGRPRDGLLSLSIVLTLWAASAGMRAVTKALETYDVAETARLAALPLLGPLHDRPGHPRAPHRGGPAGGAARHREHSGNASGWGASSASLWLWLRSQAVVALCCCS